MPGRDGTGPVGMGPMRKGKGRCAGYASPGYSNVGAGAGRGRGFRRMYYATGLPGWARCGIYPHGYTSCADTGVEPAVSEKEILKDQVKFLEEQLKSVRERLDSLKED